MRSTHRLPFALAVPEDNGQVPAVVVILKNYRRATASLLATVGNWKIDPVHVAHTHCSSASHRVNHRPGLVAGLIPLVQFGLQFGGHIRWTYQNVHVGAIGQRGIVLGHDHAVFDNPGNHDTLGCHVANLQIHDRIDHWLSSLVSVLMRPVFRAHTHGAGHPGTDRATTR